MTGEETLSFVYKIRKTFNNLSVNYKQVQYIIDNLKQEFENSYHRLHRRSGSRRRIRTCFSL